MQINNRIDVLDERNSWLEARIVDVFSFFNICKALYLDKPEQNKGTLLWL